MVSAGLTIIAEVAVNGNPTESTPENVAWKVPGVVNVWFNSIPAALVPSVIVQLPVAGGVPPLTVASSPTGIPTVEGLGYERMVAVGSELTTNGITTSTDVPVASVTVRL